MGTDFASTPTLTASRFSYQLPTSIFAVRDERFKVILAPRTGLGWGQGEGRGRTREPEYVFDLAVDPAETHNLAGSPEPAARRARLALFAWIERGLAAAPGGSEAAPDAAAQDRLRALGYLD